MEGIHNTQQREHDIEQKREKDREVLTRIEKKRGKLNSPLKVMAKRPGTVASFMKYWAGVFEDGPLSEKERALVAIGTAVAMRSEQCVSTHSDRARKAGAHEDEIVQAMLIASAMLGASPLHSAYSGVSDE